jgi:hypothetical protein
VERTITGPYEPPSLLAKETKVIHRMKNTLNALTTVILIAFGGPAAIAQTDANAKSDEQLLRKLIREDNEGKNVIKRTEDSIFVSGAFPRPMIGHAVQEALVSRKDRSNESRKGEVVRLVISQSGREIWLRSSVTSRSASTRPTRSTSALMAHT